MTKKNKRSTGNLVLGVRSDEDIRLDLPGGETVFLRVIRGAKQIVIHAPPVVSVKRVPSSTVFMGLGSH